MSQPVIFLSYSHEDETLKDRLVRQLRVLKSAGIDLWSDDRIPPGVEWRSEIDRALGNASVAVLLVTARFLTSEYILDTEVPKIIKRHEDNGLKIFPVIARPCAWTSVDWLEKMQVRPKGGKPVWGGGRDPERLLAEITGEIEAIINAQPGVPAPPPHASSERGDPLELGHKALEERRRKFGDYRTQVKVTIPDVSDFISLALRHGVPLYNSGDKKGCAGIYVRAAQLLAELLREVVDPMLIDRAMGFDMMYERFEMMTSTPLMRPILGLRWTRHHSVLQMAHDELITVIKETTGRKGGDPGEIAWAVRHVFDSILMAAMATAAIDSSLEPEGETGWGRSSLIREVVQKANSSSMMIYNEGMMRGKHWIRACAAIYLYAAQGLLPHLSEPNVASVRDLIAERIYGKKYADPVSQVGGAGETRNAYEVAWVIRHAFDLLATKLR